MRTTALAALVFATPVAAQPASLEDLIEGLPDSYVLSTALGVGAADLGERGASPSGHIEAEVRRGRHLVRLQYDAVSANVLANVVRMENESVVMPSLLYGQALDVGSFRLSLAAGVGHARFTSQAEIQPATGGGSFDCFLGPIVGGQGCEPAQYAKTSASTVAVPIAAEVLMDAEGPAMAGLRASASFSRESPFYSVGFIIRFVPDVIRRARDGE